MSKFYIDLIVYIVFGGHVKPVQYCLPNWNFAVNFHQIKIVHIILFISARMSVRHKQSTDVNHWFFICFMNTDTAFIFHISSFFMILLFLLLVFFLLIFNFLFYQPDCEGDYTVFFPRKWKIDSSINPFCLSTFHAYMHFQYFYIILVKQKSRPQWNVKMCRSNHIHVHVRTHMA